jgi:hypothetical protein
MSDPVITKLATNAHIKTLDSLKADVPEWDFAELSRLRILRWEIGFLEPWINISRMAKGFGNLQTGSDNEDSGGSATVEMITVAQVLLVDFESKVDIVMTTKPGIARDIRSERHARGARDVLNTLIGRLLAHCDAQSM